MSAAIKLFCEPRHTKRDTEEINGIAGPSQPPAERTIEEIATKLLVNTLGDVGKAGHAWLTQKRNVPIEPK